MTDVLTFLAIVCVPILSVGIAFNLRGPLGRALAERLRRSDESSELAAVEARLEHRLRSLEHSIDAIAVELERQGEQQRALLGRSMPSLPSKSDSPPPTPRLHRTPPS